MRKVPRTRIPVCNLAIVHPEGHSARGLSVVSLFSGIAGIELGLQASGFEPEMFCESWDPARAVLEHRFGGVPIAGDVRSLRTLPRADLLTAGFPCNDISQAGRMAGITGPQSGLVTEVFRLLEKSPVPTVFLENVRNMISLGRGAAMRSIVAEFERLGYRWAYRVVDSRFVGVPQRRQRVIFLASRVLDPRAVLHGDDAGEPGKDRYDDGMFGFYWTEGSRGLGWARDATPALKNGSTLGLASPPAIWHQHGEVGRRILTPTVNDGERLQGFPRGWTAPARQVSRKEGIRWRLIGNAVTVGVARWLGRRLTHPAVDFPAGRVYEGAGSWPLSGYGEHGRVYDAGLSMWPRLYKYRHLRDVINVERANPLSPRATSGFYQRAQRSSLTFEAGFQADVAAHLKAVS